jgi:GT2 family glycosyltransferase
MPDSGSAPKVSVVIPNINGATPREGLMYLEMIRETLAAQSFRDFDVAVVDNGSTDGSIAYLEEHWPEVRIFALGENAGFPAAVNRGVEGTAGEYVALLNNDLELSPDWMQRLVAELDREPRLGFVTGKIVSHADRGLIEQAGQDLYTCGRFQPRGLDEEDTGQYDERREVPIVTAAASLYRRAAIEAAGGFDEDYFLYCEDADLCLRMLLAGYGGLYVPEPTAFHVRGGTAGRQSETTRFYLGRNTLITLLKDLPASVLLRSLPKIALYQYHQLVAARTDGFARTQLRAWAGFLRQLPRTLRKRRRIQRSRRVPAAEFEAELLKPYPLPTVFNRRRSPRRRS